MEDSEIRLALQTLAQQLQETRNALEKLAAVTTPRVNADEELEWSLDVKDWVLKTKLNDLRKKPRGDRPE